MIHHGDCLDVMADMDPESVDAIVTDPPYNLTANFNWGSLETSWEGKPRYSPGQGGFMGKEWDGTGVAFRRETWEAAYRVAKPSAYLLAFGGTRTVHRMTCALEDAGWIIRDMLVWGYASGFPKGRANLKPAWEPIVMARKPGPLRMLAIDECRIEAVDGTTTARARSVLKPGAIGYLRDDQPMFGGDGSPLGRWPANIVLTDPIFDGGIEGVVGGGEAAGMGDARVLRRGVESGSGMGLFNPNAPVGDGMAGYGDTGTYSRFFLVPKAARSDREPVLGGLPYQNGGSYDGNDDTEGARKIGARPDVPNRARANVHPTVKPVDLMRHLVRLVTPTGGTVLDPFLGSGTTALAAEMEGFAWIGIEREAEYVAIAEARLNGTQKGMAL